MASALSDLSVTALSNGTKLGQQMAENATPPSAVNNAVRGWQAYLAMWMKDNDGSVASGGTATAVTATLNQGFTAYGTGDGQIKNGERIAIKMGSAATGAATVNINALGAKAIRREGDTAISANDWSANSTVLLRYDTAYNAAAGGWVLLNSDAAGWAAITRAAGFDTFAATPTSANLRSLMTDETGTGALVFGTSPTIASPTISTSITSPGDFIVDSTAGTNSTFKGTKVLLWATGAGSSMELDAGTVSPGIVLTRGQLAFPATQNASSNANTLDDYEEGTWTPVLSFGGGTTGITYVQQLGRYVKVGKLTLLSFQIFLSSKGSSAGTAAISGFPFTDPTINMSVVLNQAINFTGLTGVLAGVASATNTFFAINQSNSTGNNGSVSDTNFTNSTLLNGFAVFTATN